MGTRGLIGYVIDGQRYACYHGHDSYPDHLGRLIVKFILSLEQEQCVKMAGLVKNIEWIEDRDGDGNVNDMKRILEGKEVRLPERVKFLEDKIFCEWAYFTDFEKERLEVWYFGKFLDEITFQGLREQGDVFLHDISKGDEESEEEWADGDSVSNYEIKDGESMGQQLAAPAIEK